MIRIGNAIRLTPKDIEDLTVLTGVAPGKISTVAQFWAYIEQSKDLYPGADEDSRIIRGVIDRVATRLMREHLATPLTYRRAKTSRFQKIALVVRDLPWILCRVVFARKAPPAQVYPDGRIASGS